MKQLKILHITPWYPSYDQPKHAIWIKRHIEALDTFCENKVLHFQISNDSEASIRHTEKGLVQHILSVPIKMWRLKEWLYFLGLSYYLLFKYKTKEFDVINFHIAYPSLVYFHFIKPFISSKIAVTEHWSYYHFHFYSNRNLTRIKRIFKRNCTLIAVSEQLHGDIESFCGRNIEKHIVPNAVNTDIFNWTADTKRKKVLLMGAYWKHPKRPFLFLDYAEQFLETQPEWEIRIYGYGPMSRAIEMWCEDWGQKWLGMLDENQIAKEMAECFGFVMPSDFETFSVGCAEALCCGTPILVSDKGALSELLNCENGMNVQEDGWLLGINRFIASDWKHESIAHFAQDKYSFESVGSKYFKVLSSI